MTEDRETVTLTEADVGKLEVSDADIAAAKQLREQREKQQEQRRQEAAAFRAHKLAELLEALDNGWLPQGVRLVGPDRGPDGKVIVFSPEEAETLVEHIRHIIEVRGEQV